MKELVVVYGYNTERGADGERASAHKFTNYPLELHTEDIVGVDGCRTLQRYCIIRYIMASRDI